MSDGFEGSFSGDEGFSSGGGFEDVVGFDVGFQVGEGAADGAGEAWVVEGEERSNAFVVELRARKGGKLKSVDGERSEERA